MIVIILAIFPTICFANQWVVVASKNFPLNEISEQDLKSVYVGRIQRLNGSLVKPIHQAPQTPAFQVFSQNVLGKRPYQVVQQLMLRYLSGRGLAPAFGADDRQLVEWLVRIPHSLGYINTSSMTDSLKSLLTIKGDIPLK